MTQDERNKLIHELIEAITLATSDGFNCADQILAVPNCLAHLGNKRVLSVVEENKLSNFYYQDLFSDHKSILMKRAWRLSRSYTAKR